MIIQKVQTNQITDKYIYNKQDCRTQVRKKSISKVQYRTNTIQKFAIYQQNRKRLQNYNLAQYNKQNRIQQDMSQSKIAKLNKQIQERTKYYIQHGKFFSKFQQDHFQYKPSYISSKIKISPSQSSGNKDYSKSLNSRFNNQYKFQTPISFNFLNVPQPQIYQKSRAPRVTFADQYTCKPLNQNSQINYRQNIKKDISEDEFYDLSDKKNALKYHPNQANNVFKQQIKQNVKDDVKNIVGQQNYQILGNIKDSAVQIKNNAIQTFKHTAYDSTEPLNTKNMVVQGSKKAKQVAKQGTKDTKKPIVGTQNFQILKYIKDAIGQIKNNIFGPDQTARPQVKIQHSINKQSPNRRQANGQSIQYYDAMNQVSPISYSQRTFIKNSADQLNSFWIYGLIFIAFFLVFFQIIK